MGEGQNKGDANKVQVSKRQDKTRGNSLEVDKLRTWCHPPICFLLFFPFTFTSFPILTNSSSFLSIFPSDIHLLKQLFTQIFTHPPCYITSNTFTHSLNHSPIHPSSSLTSSRPASQPATEAFTHPDIHPASSQASRRQTGSTRVTAPHLGGKILLPAKSKT